MADVPSYADLFDAAEREILIRPTSFNPEIVRVDGSDVNIAIAASAGMAQEVARFAQAAFNETHLSTAIAAGGEVLDRWAYDRYGITRQESQAAVVTLEFRRSAAVIGFTIESGSVVASTNGQNFETINDVPFSIGEGGPLIVRAVAQQTGTAGNVAVSTITQIVSKLDDSTVTVDNPTTAAGGSPEETDDEFGARIRDFHVNARRGTIEAIRTGATSTEGVSEATVIESIDPATAEPNFRVQVVIADPAGQSNAALAQRVIENLVTFRGLGVPVNVVAGTPQFVTITIEGLLFDSTANTSDVLDEARNAILGAVNGLAPNVTLRVAVIIAALQTVEKLIVPSGAVKVPAGDLVPVSGGVIRTKKDLVSLNGV